MTVSCPRCRQPIQPDWDHCHGCGLTVEQLDKLVKAAGLEARAADDELGPWLAPEGSPAYYSPPVYGQGPTRRSTGYVPPTPGVSDLRRTDTVIDLSQGEARVRLPAGATVPVPPAPRAPRLRPPATPMTLAHKVELALTVCIAIAAVLLAALFLR